MRQHIDNPEWSDANSEMHSNLVASPVPSVPIIITFSTAIYINTFVFFDKKDSNEIKHVIGLKMQTLLWHDLLNIRIVKLNSLKARKND